MGSATRVGPSGQMESFIRNLGTNENYVNLNPKPYKKNEKKAALPRGPFWAKGNFYSEIGS